MTSQNVTLVIHNVRSALNVGSMFRTADAAGVGKIYLTGYSPTPQHEKVKKTALGGEKSVPWEQVRQPARLLKALKKEGYQIVALEQTKKSVDYRKFKPIFSIALLVGNEVKGISPAILKYCDVSIDLPMRGGKESLNVAVACGIALYKLTE